MIRLEKRRVIAGVVATVFTIGMFSGCTRRNDPGSASATSEGASTAVVASSTDDGASPGPISSQESEISKIVQEQIEIDTSAAAAFADALLTVWEKEESYTSEPEGPDNFTEFEDVDPEAYYYEALLWGLDNEIVSGTSETTFSPDEACTRAQTMTLLYALAGKPGITIEDYPFDDIAEPEGITGVAIAWAASAGIAAGIEPTIFAPDDAVTRLQMVTFLWRLAGQPEPLGTGEIWFTDTEEPAVRWAVEQSIVNGTSDETFSPDDYCTRGQVITFIYRYAIGAGIEFTRTHIADIPVDHSPVTIGSEKPGTAKMVSLHIPAMYVGDKTQADVDEMAKQHGIQAAVLNQDGSLILKMSESVQQQLLETIRGNISTAMAEIPGCEWYPTVTTVYADDAYTVFTVQTTATTTEEAKEIPLSELVLYSWIYARYSGNEQPSVLVIIANDSTGEILREARSSQSEKE